jgi:osmotically-inducible protein OsmY
MTLQAELYREEPVHDRTLSPQEEPMTLSRDVDLVHSITRLYATAGDVDPSAVSVTAADGRVTLSGEVATHAERLAAARRAASVAGVVHVDNLLRVRDLDIPSSMLTDAEITEGVARAVRDSTVRVDDLQVDTHQHVVTVRGRVTSTRDQSALRHAVQHVPGVHFVRDLIDVEAPAEPSAVEELQPAECFRLLAGSALGRLAVEDESGVDVFPVNYLVHENSIYFRSGPGTKLIRLTGAPHVAFEVDGEEHGLTWSVVVKGVAHRLDSDEEIRASGIDEGLTAHPSEKLNYIRIRPQQVSGRRFRTARSGST